MPGSERLPQTPPSAPDRRRAAGARWSALSDNVRGALCVIAGAFLLIIMAGIVKHLGQSLPSFQVVFVRFLAGLVALLPVVLRTGRGVLRTARLPMHLTRSLVGFAGNLCFFYALVNMAIATTVTIQFSRPLIMVVIALLLLRERVGPERVAATLAGFGGVLMITRPFGEGFEPWALVALSGTLFGTLVVLSIKRLSATENTLTIMFYFALFTTLFAFVPALFVWVAPTPAQLALLVLTGVLGIAGQSLFTHGVGLGETSFVLPFDYLRIVYAFVIGLAFFGELPGAWSLAGTAVIAGSSFYLLRTERRARPAAPQEIQ